MSSFGDVTYEQQQAATDAASAAPTTTEPEIDINDPRLVSENIEIDPQGDAYAMPPVLTDGKWRAKLVAREVGKPPNQRKFAPKADNRDANKLYLYTALEADVIDHSGKFDGIKVPDYFVSTQVRRDGTSQAATILARLGKPAERTTTHGTLMTALLGALAGEPELTIETEWEANCQKCEEAAAAKGERKPRSIRGMHNFPQQKDAKGKFEFVPRMKCTVNPQHGEMFARPRIVHYLALDGSAK